MAAGFHKVHFNMNGFQLLTVQFGLELVTSKAEMLRNSFQNMNTWKQSDSLTESNW